MDASALATLKKSLEDRGVKYVLPTYSDMHGRSKSKMVPMSHFAKAMAGSELFTGAAVEGVPQDVNDEEVASHPDPASCTVLPWRPEVAWFASDLHCEGKLFEPCSRNILGRVVAQAASMGYGVHAGIEAEFCVLKDGPNGTYVPMGVRPNLEKPAYDVVRLLENMHWMDELIGAMNQLGWGVYSFDHEDAIGQFEVDFNYFEVKTMADRMVFFRMMADEIARKHGGFASFMPKPFGDRAGSGAHFNLSLFDAKDPKKNLFQSTDDARKCGLSKVGYQFIAGVLKHLPAITAVVAPTVNSYKRLVPRGSRAGFTWAPVFVCYGGNNRTNTVRIPLGGGRIELRLADASCNPYLGFAMVVAAGLEGIRDKLDPGEPHWENMYLKTAEERRKLGVAMLPRSLGEALDAFEADPLSRAVMGEKMFGAWLEFKREEWHAYSVYITDWEKDRYLKFF
jgi:glutamine synthetase